MPRHTADTQSSASFVCENSQSVPKNLLSTAALRFVHKNAMIHYKKHSNGDIVENPLEDRTVGGSIPEGPVARLLEQFSSAH